MVLTLYAVVRTGGKQYRVEEGALLTVATLEGEPGKEVTFGDVLLLADGDMRAQGSGVPLSQEFALLCTLKGGLTITAQEYYDHAEALRVVGLS